MHVSAQYTRNISEWGRPGQSPANRPNIRFWVETIEDKAATQAEGRFVAREVEICAITIPGDTKSVVERKVTNQIKEIYAPEYQAWKAGQEVAAVGTPIERFPDLRPAEIQMLRHANIMTVEALAGLPDAHLQNVGPWAANRREQARAFLQAQSDSNAAVAFVEKYKDLKGEYEREQASRKALEDRLLQLERLVQAQAEQLDAKQEQDRFDVTRVERVVGAKRGRRAGHHDEDEAA